MNYSELNLDPKLYSAIEKLNYSTATPIQEQALPNILAGKDVAGLAQTGTGKTAAFLIPLIERILKTTENPQHERAFKDWNARSFILILVPTRELADQINENVVKLCEFAGLKSFPLYGGTGYDKQKEALNSGLQFVISTPGRLIDLYKENHIDLKQVSAIVFDEADRMFDMGFKEDMKYILGRVPRERQFLVFSATLNFDVLNTAYQFGAEPVEINISRDQATADHVKDFILHVGDQEKPQFLISVLKKENPKQAMIFTNFKHHVDRLADFLISNHVPAMGISSLMSQQQRNRVIEKFKADNNQNILVATDVAARGLDITGVDLVINFEMPQDAESYVHRIGRTGRAGREGKAFSLISDKDIDSLARVEEYAKKKIENIYLEDGDLVKDFNELTKDEGRFQKRFDRPKHRNEKKKFDNKNFKGPKESQNEFRGQGVKEGRQFHKGPRSGQQQPVEAQASQALDKGQKRFTPANQKPHSKTHSQSRPQNQSQTKPTHQNAAPSKSFRQNANKSTKSASVGLGQKVKTFIKRLFG